ncbi:MAG: DUF3426 domain-containing protein [Parvibaculum sp.]|uniref:DUF3426 domain-containing protein n=1 Tax=Parvibaculum sp. TaxID=2024848 RepID=UPI003C70C1F9
MIITCPSCSTRYPVDAASFAPSGRKVRCARCGHSWHQAPPTDLPRKGEPAVEDDIGFADAAAAAGEAEAPVAEPLPVLPAGGPLFKSKAEVPAAADGQADARAEMPADVPADAQAGAGEDASATDAAPPSQLGNGGRLRAFIHNAASTRRGRVLGAIGWVLLVGFVASTAYAGWHWRQDIAVRWPATTTLYAAVDKPINLRGFELRGVGYERQTENGLPVLAIKGEVVNVSGERRAVPRLRVALFDQHQRELYHWTFALVEKDIAPMEAASFVTRLSSPPVEARDLELRFVQKDEDREAAKGEAAKGEAEGEAAASEKVLPSETAGH